MTQETLAAKVGLTQGMISHLETGETDYTGGHLELLSRALNCSIFELLFVNPLTGAIDSQAADHPIGIYEALPDREKRQAIEIMKGLKRASDL